MNNVLKWLVIGGLFLIPFAPLMVSSGMMFPFITGKAFFFRIIVEIVFALYLILAVRDQEYRPKKSWISAATTLFLLVVLLADTFGVNPHKSFWSNFERMEGFFMILHLWMFYIVASAMLIKKHWDYFLGTSVCVSMLVMWYGLFQIAGKIDIRQGAERLDSTLGNAAYFAVYILLNMGFALYLYLQRKDQKSVVHYVKTDFIWYGVSILLGLFFALMMFPYFATHLPIPVPTQTHGVTHTALLLSIGFWMALGGAIVYFAGIVLSKIAKTTKYNHFLYLVTVVSLQLYLIFKSATRGTMLGIAVALVVTSIIYAWKGKEDKVGRIISIVILALVIVSSTGLLVGKNSAFVKNNRVLNRVASISFDNARTKYIWPIAFKGIAQKPILGYGQEGFNYAFNKFYNPKMWTEEQWFDRAHNVFLDWFVAAGVLGFLGYISLYLLSLWTIWKGEFSFREKIVLIGLLIAYAVHNMTVFDNISSYILFFAFLAFLHGHSAKQHIKKVDINVDVRDLIVIPAIAIVSVVLLYFVNIAPISASEQVIDGIRTYQEGKAANLAVYQKLLPYNLTGSQEVREQIIQNVPGIISEAKTDDVKQAAYILARQAIDKQIAYAPLDTRAYIIGGEFLNRTGQYADASTLLLKANELTPTKQAPLFDLATGLITQGKNAEALEVLKKALALDPEYPEAQNFYIVALLYNNNVEEIDRFVKEYPPKSISEMLISVFLEKKQFTRLISILKSFAAAYPEEWRIRKSIAAAYFKAGDTNSAIQTLEDTIKEFPVFETEGNELIKYLKAGVLK